MRKYAHFFVVFLMLVFCAGGVGYTAATTAPADIKAAGDGNNREKYRTIPEAEFSTGYDETKLHLIDGGGSGDRMIGSVRADSPDADVLSRAAECSSRYVSATGSDTIGSDSNGCLDVLSPCRTIQHAIDVSGGTETCPVVIHVAAGTYDEHILMNSWESLDGGWNSDFSQQWDFENDGLEPTLQYATAIDGAGSGTCITQNSLAGANINGFTIQNGRGLGGGIFLDHSHPAIANCMIIENYGKSDSEEIRSAGGLYNYYSNPTVENCAFGSNDCLGSEDYTHACAVLNENSQAAFINSSFTGTMLYHLYVWKGSGMVNVNSAPLITRCRFEDNNGGMGARCPLVNFDSSVRVTDSIFIHNCFDEGGPGAVENVGSVVTIINSLFLSNETIESDSAAAVGNASSVCTIINSVFAGNLSTHAEWGKVIDNRDSEWTVVNSTFAENGFAYNFDFGAVIGNSENSHGIVKNSIIWASRLFRETNAVVALSTDASSTLDVAFSDIDQDGFEGLNGNIRKDPKFAGTGWDDNGTPDDFEDDKWIGGDIHLQKDSPCIDSGTQDDVALEDADFEGDPRVMDGDIDFSAQVDMGADEFDPAKGVCFISALMD